MTTPQTGPLNSFNDWKAAPNFDNLPQKVTRQEFVDHTAATAAKQPGTGPGTRRSDGSADSLDMRTWSGDRTGDGIVAGLSGTRVRSSTLPASSVAGVFACARRSRWRGAVQMAAAALIAGSIVACALSTAGAAISALLGTSYTNGYTLSERIAADPWNFVVICFAVFVIIPPVVLLANIALPRKFITPLVHNRISASVLIALSGTALLGVPLVHIFANATAYDEFSSSFNFDPVPVAPLGAASGAFLNLMRTGPLADGAADIAEGVTTRGAADVGVVHPGSGASLAGGFITGPGNAKVTFAQATAMCDLAFAMLRFPDEAKAMADVPALLSHGAEFLTAAYNPADGSLVSAVYDTALAETQGEWRRVEQVAARDRQVLLVNGTGTEVYALSAHPPAALAAVFQRAPSVAPRDGHRVLSVTPAARVQRRRRWRRRRRCCASSTMARRTASRR